MRKVLLIIGVLAVLACGVGGFIAYRALDLGKEINASSITQEQFDAQRLKGAESAVRGALPKPLSDIDEKDIYGKNDPTSQGRPPGASCSYYTAKPITDGADVPLFRFCFAGGKLVEKKRVTIVDQ